MYCVSQNYSLRLFSTGRNVSTTLAQQLVQVCSLMHARILYAKALQLQMHVLHVQRLVAKQVVQENTHQPCKPRLLCVLCISHSGACKKAPTHTRSTAHASRQANTYACKNSSGNATAAASCATTSTLRTLGGTSSSNVRCWASCTPCWAAAISTYVVGDDMAMVRSALHTLSATEGLWATRPGVSSARSSTACS